MPDLSKRSMEAEIIDDATAPEDAVIQNLRELEVINKWLGGYGLVLHALKPFAKNGMTILDLGCGGGDMLRTIAGWAARRKLNVELTGIDMNPVMVSYAAAQSKDYLNIRYRVLNVFDDSLMEQQADVVIASLFCHHFTDNALIDLIKRMEVLAADAVIISDLHRHWFAWHAINVLTFLFSKTYMVKHDARLSVARAFTRSELTQLLAQAGIKVYSLKWRWAWRWELVIPKAKAA